MIKCRDGNSPNMVGIRVGSGGPWGRERPIGGEEGIAWLSWDALPAICYGRSYGSTTRSKGSLVWTFPYFYFFPLPSLFASRFVCVRVRWQAPQAAAHRFCYSWDHGELMQNWILAPHIGYPPGLTVSSSLLPYKSI